MSDQDGKQVAAVPRPATEDAEAWKAYWQAHGQPWRTMPEIDTKRQEELAQRRQIAPDIDKGIYPFKGMKLSRADVEWLLASTHGSRGGEENDWRRPGPPGLDVRGADLRQVDLNLLPLARLRAGLNYDEWIHATAEQRAMAVVRLEGASLHWAHLQGAYFAEAHLEGSDLRGAFFTSATNLVGISLSNETFGLAFLGGVRWDDVELSVVDWTRVVLRSRNKYGQYLFSAFLDVLAGYGYRPRRSVLWYLATIVVFALGYHVSGHLSLWPPDAFVYSLTSFHGRGFFPGLEGMPSLHDPLILLAAVEAVVGLVIEISFIATFTQRSRPRVSSMPRAISCSPQISKVGALT